LDSKVKIDLIVIYVPQHRKFDVQFDGTVPFTTQPNVRTV